MALGSSPVRLDIPGTPVPQGSKTAFVVGGRAVLAEANKRLKPWREHVARVARAQAGGFEFTGPVAVTLLFLFERPKSVKRALPSVKPDLDKLVRAIFDGLTAAGVWTDDALVVDVRAVKRYAATSGVVVTINAVDETANEREMK